MNTAMYMQQRIVIQVHVDNDKSRRKALNIVANTHGAYPFYVQNVVLIMICDGHVKLTGEESDQVVVTGDGVDPVCLTNQMRKKFPCATLLRVEEVEEPEEGGDEGDGGEEEEEETKECEISPLPHNYNYFPLCPICVVNHPPSPMYSHDF
ncbi:Heavy metal-associated isoprenylated plant protein 16, partial [Mucuna pruriens]